MYRTNDNKINYKSALLCFSLTAIAFFIPTYFSNTIMGTFDVTGVRPSAAFNPVLGIAFGWPAILGCAFGNFLCDIASDFSLTTALLGFVPQIIFGAFPYYVWKAFTPSLSQRTRLDSPKKTIIFALLMLVSSAIIGAAVGGIQYFVSGDSFIESSFFAFINDFNMCMVFGLPLMALIDYVYSKYRHKGKRKLSANELIILISAALELIIFIILIIVENIKYSNESREFVWTRLFSITGSIVNILVILSVVAMYIYHHYKVKHAGLRVFEKKNGTVYADDQKKLEFISRPGTDLKHHVKSSLDGESFTDFLKATSKPSYEETWYASLSGQKGCPMQCQFCDCHTYGFYGNASREDLAFQMKTILETSGSTSTKRFEVDFMRMGEPSFNDDILDFIEYDLRSIISESVNAAVIYPYLSTMMPKTGDRITKYLNEFCRIKNEVYDGEAALQISIHSTDDTVRNKIFRNRSRSLKEIADIVNQLPTPKGRKYALNFAVSHNSVIKAEVIDQLFDKGKCLIKLTPIHSTFNASDNGFVSKYDYNDYSLFQEIEDRFKELGWEVMTFMDSKDEDDESLSCGNLLLTTVPDKVKVLNTEKKKIGMVVAIEMEAIYKYYDKWKEIETPSGFKLLCVEKENYIMYIIQSGMGEIAASCATQYLISKCGVSKIFNFGVVGGMTADMKQLKTCLVDTVVHYKYDTSEMNGVPVGLVDNHDSIYLKPDANLLKNAMAIDNSLPCVTCCSGDKFIGTMEEKQYLNATFHGEICDMESAGIFLTCEANDIPCLFFKAVSDGLADGAEGFYAELYNASIKCVTIADKVIERIAAFE